MAKAAPDATLDSELSYIAGSTVMHLCSGEPANYAGIAAVSLADVTMAGGDFTIANGDVSGRKVTVAAKTAVPVDATGTATHVALAKVSDTTLRYVTTMTSQALTIGNTVDIGSFKVEMTDPT